MRDVTIHGIKSNDFENNTSYFSFVTNIEKYQLHSKECVLECLNRE